ncbi:MAG TPA: branched-chain amino acid ABC transporter substrate-binding protein [Candidatus Eisenbacteria bacterium]|nr:branched-chain amino acid ABC transporter substrate-binding protein [Candidatus Eisenbacteria bacterium]
MSLRRPALVLALFLAFCGTASAEEETVSIGLVAPLTGDQAYIGIGVMQGAQMAVEEANIRGPVFGNAKLKLVPLDDQHNPTQAVLAANKLVSDPDVVAVVGHFNSSCTKPASAIYHEGRMAQVTPASTNPQISKQGFDTFFRLCATDDVQAPAAADFARSKLGAANIVILDDQTTYGKGLADEFEKYFKAAGGNVLRRDGITQGEKDFTPLLTKVKSVKPELIFYGGVYPELALLLKQSAKVGLTAPWMGGDGIYDPSLVRLAGPKLTEGIYSTMLGVDPHELPTAKDFVARYEARYGEIGSFSAYAYDSTNVLIEAIRRAGKKDREAILAEVRKTKDFPGILGPVNFNADGDAVGKSVGIFRVEGGKFKFLEEVKPKS